MNTVILGGGETLLQASGALHHPHNVTIINKNKAQNLKEPQVL